MALAIRATASIPFFANLLRLNPSPQVVASFAARSIHTVAPLRNYPKEETVKRNLEYLNLLESSKHSIRRPPPTPYFSFTAAASPFAGRCRFFSSSASINDHTCSPSSRGKLLRSSSKAWMRPLLFTTALEMMCNVKEYEVEVIVIVDMPGIGKPFLNLVIESNSVNMEGYIESILVGKRENDSEYEDEDMKVARVHYLNWNVVGLEYYGLIDIPPGFYNTDQIEGSTENSKKSRVLKIVIPKLKAEEMKDSSLTPPLITFNYLWRIMDLDL